METKTRNQTSQNKNFIDFLITIEVFSFFENLNQTVKGQKKKKEIRTCSFFLFLEIQQKHPPADTLEVQILISIIL